MKRTLFSLILVAALLTTGCRQPSVKQYSPAQVKFAAAYNPNLYDVIYPSMVLALANHSGDFAQPLFQVEVTAPTNDAVLRVVIDSSALNYVTIVQEVLPKKGERYTFAPKLKWKYDRVYNLRQQGAIDLTFTCYINDEEVDVKNLRLNYRTVNECPITILDRQGKAQDYRWLFAAYVNEDHPYIDSILNTILQQGMVTTFTGYQRGSKEVKKQVEAVWYYALNRGITYSSISCTSNPNHRGRAQHVRYFDEVYLNRQANCVDACVFFSSILRKIGISPVILVEPCHAYLGYYTDKNKKNLALLETTCTAWANFPALDASVDTASGLASEEQLERVAKYTTPEHLQQYREGKLSLTKLKQEVSNNIFKQAGEYDKERYAANRELFIDTTQQGYHILDIDQLRKVVQPIMRP